MYGLFSLTEKGTPLEAEAKQLAIGNKTQVFHSSDLKQWKKLSGM